MWILVMFDLPTLTKPERRAALNFRNYLLDEGFEMSQLSVYMRHTHSREKAKALSKRIIKAVPIAGKISIIFFTDKQFGEIISYFNCKEENIPSKPDQYILL